jgi:hypothetical protein
MPALAIQLSRALIATLTTVDTLTAALAVLFGTDATSGGTVVDGSAADEYGSLLMLAMTIEISIAMVVLLPPETANAAPRRIRIRLHPSQRALDDRHQQRIGARCSFAQRSRFIV